MSVLTSLLLLGLSATVDVNLAPDQPLPYIYVDDPLILEFRTEAEGVIEAEVEIVAAHRPDAPIQIDLPGIPIRAQGSRWHAIENLPTEQGFYTVTTTATINGESSQSTHEFCRIERNTNNRLDMVTAHGLSFDAHTMPALQNAAIGGIRLEANAPDIQDRIQHAAMQGFDVIVHIDSQSVEAPEELIQELAEYFCPDITRWEITINEEISLLERVVQTLRSVSCTAPVALTVRDAAHLQDLLQQGVGLYIRDIVLMHDAPERNTIRALQQSIQAAGYESWRIHVEGVGIPIDADTDQEEKLTDTGTGLLLVQQLLNNLTAGVTSTGIDSRLVYNAGLGESLVYLNALAQLLPNQQHVGPAFRSTLINAPLFRKGNDWVIPLWTSGNARSVDLPVDGVNKLALTDVLNNPLPTPALNGSNDTVSIEIGQQPVFLSGEGGNMISTAARNMARQRAEELLNLASDPSLETMLFPQETQAIIDRIAENANADVQRTDFLMLLRSFPDLEQRWHHGELPQNITVPALANLANLARALCTLEHERESPFLEPMQDTLTRAEEFQSLYLTGSTSSNTQGQQRGDWLLREVRRLMDEVDELVQEGNKEEAAALANLAEWRARGLEFAAEAAPPDEAARLAQAVAAEQPHALQTAELLDRPIAPGDGEETPEAEAEIATEAETEETETGSEEIIHQVVAGDTPMGIANQYGVSLSDFRRWNNLGANPVVRIGEEYVIRPTSESPDAEDSDEAESDETGDNETDEASEEETLEPGQPAGTRKVTHSVVSGDNPTVIADRYNVSLEDFLDWNDLDQGVVLQIGEEYTVYVAD